MAGGALAEPAGGGAGAELRTTVIIPNLDSPLVDRAVAAVFAQIGPPPEEVLVVGRDGPGRLAGERRVRLIDTGGPRLPGAARNIGMRAAGAATTLFVFLDADCVPEPGWLAAHRARQAAGETVVGGAVLYDTDNIWTLADNLSMFHPADPSHPAGPRPFLPTLNLSVRRAAAEAAGGMDPALPRGEDLDWTIRLGAAGHRPFFDPAARIWHRPPRATPGAVWQHWYLGGRWMPGVRRRHPAVFGASARLYHPALALLLAPAIAALATARLYRPGAPGWRHRRTLPLVYLTKLAWCCGAARPLAVHPSAPPVSGGI